MDLTKTFRDESTLPADAMACVFRDLTKDVSQFRQEVAAAGGRIPKGSQLDTSLNRTILAAPYFLDNTITTVSVDDLAEAIHVAFLLRCETHAKQQDLGGRTQWLRRLKGEDILCSREGKQSKMRNTTWEFIVAALCNRFATKCEFSEPDVRCTFNDERWGLACKLLYSADLDQQTARIIEGADQLDRCPELDYGAVLVNVTPLLDRTLWSRSRVSDVDESGQAFAGEMERIARRLHRPNLYERFLRRPKARSFMLFGQALFDAGDVLGLFATAAFPTNLRSASPNEADFIRALNFASATVWQ